MDFTLNWALRSFESLEKQEQTKEEENEGSSGHILSASTDR